MSGGVDVLPVFGRVQGACGVVTLNRPQAINALSVEMVRLVTGMLRVWESDDRVEVVVLRGAGERGFCAGGDVRRQRELALAGGTSRLDALAFWQEEYALDGLVASYSKPVVAVMDGVTMGGGVGLSGFADVRVVTSFSKVAMPELTIGFFPDVGATRLLASAPGELGTHLALTGHVMDAADAIAVGLADVFVDTSVDGGAVDALVERLGAGRSALADLVGDDPGPSALLESAQWVDRCYAGSDPVAIVQALRSSGVEAAGVAADVIESRSPLAVHIALRALREAAAMSCLEEVLARDALLARWFTDCPDFHEGVRAQLVDKDRSPRWMHGSLSEVRQAEVEAAFEAH
ncbi:3-hydroxyisobutyryl-CoA hydrolase [Dermatophilus congolensis]|uniref:3-hydroxyisobutyryl-CoA hydrolase n=1 Tax=Dermatophilus congolensis TaxID=1863 RepID=A0A239V6P3_9MICO|nr:3-hydroxyisobutyryl-CoA hydrolase [Dermatophilus congolensis]SNV17378.1 Probable enoyl-CoA hydratase echA8 [Dermatophilus congolensis]